MTGDLPSIGSSAYGASTSVFQLANNQMQQLNDEVWNKGFPPQAPLVLARQAAPAPSKKDKPAMAAAPSRRLVQVFIADPDENVPLDKSLLYSGEQKLTDATDQELFFEIDIKSILEKHNAERIQFVNKKVKERTEFLEPVKIRDLRMVVVNVATF